METMYCTSKLKQTATREEDRETDNQGQESSGDDYLGHCSDSSSSYFLNHLSPVACEGSDASGKEEEEILAAQSECNRDLHDVQDLQRDEACCYISDDAVESTVMSSDKSSVSGDHHPKGRCRHLFECKETSQILQDHALRPNQGDLMTNVFDCPLWKTAYAPNGLFQGNSRGLSVQLSTDGVNPFSANKICYPMWPIMLSVLNWPKYCQNRFENLTLVGAISANGKEEPRSVDPYLEIVVDELMALSGTSFYEGYK